ncbi:amidohydrolase [Mycobacterium sp. CBMA293]|uniref:Amidohydrolase n=2 Tax=unclassified Mycolicibacterium TaxID=2636767 RepID=A0A1S6GKN5_9MYCO|nr:MULTISPECIES: amidohydrolase family protein [unclassified Mycolicibacterium]AQS22429.1 Amidohydrolase [Mycolicibacterium sp. CBMA 213]MUL50140.1 amidohydrolase [Mycolicibacterium sp. CBMA 360]MUL62343.1 amidohydrolase [Mycolicibacterium sp. CBMA 335]MUM04480.1 hypothetical protein [Mycolicibacterium sp. CBMA 213]MUM14743.1 amidohydrolase [Mycolicibacterium sp. CBMA 293]
MRTIALEEHFVSRSFLDRAGFGLGEQDAVNVQSSAVTDLGDIRIKAMDESGIDMQVISHVWPTFDPVPADIQVQIAIGANNQAAQAITTHPSRFAGFAALPMLDATTAADELSRAVNELGFVGALINGRADERFLDHPSLFPVLQRAADLQVPIYLHPGLPNETLRRELYDGFGPEVTYAIGTAAWGWHAETGLHAIRLIAARVFDRLPDLRIILGHMGEMIPFMLERCDEWLTPAARREGLQRTVSETFRHHFWVTTSGMFSLPPLLLLHEVLGAERILFSVDYPFSSNAQGRNFLDSLPISPADIAKISHQNAEVLLRLPAVT